MESRPALGLGNFLEEGTCTRRVHQVPGEVAFSTGVVKIRQSEVHAPEANTQTLEEAGRLFCLGQEHPWQETDPPGEARAWRRTPTHEYTAKAAYNNLRSIG